MEEEREKVIIGNEHIGMEEYLDETDTQYNRPKYYPFTILDYNPEEDYLYLDDLIYKDINGLYKHKKILKYATTNNKIIDIFKDCYDNDVCITFDKNKTLVINKDDMEDYMYYIKDCKGKKYYTVDVKRNISSNKEWEYLENLLKQIKKAKVWEDFKDLKKIYGNQKKWEKINKYYQDKKKYGFWLKSRLD